MPEGGLAVGTAPGPNTISCSTARSGGSLSGSNRDNDLGANSYDTGAAAAAGDKNRDMNAHEVESEIALAEDFEDGETVAYQDAISSSDDEATSFTEVRWTI
ncbi:hypothetical protein ON010_g13945 [Phytophthora cinnamomi]|nr:hypothetical protein ON010_g13945 [Phytophthora cinnamomi]